MPSSGEARQYLAAFTACFSVVVSGSCFGWVTPILDHLLGPESEIPMTASQSSWMIAIIELGNVLSPLPAGVLADRWGRRPSILLTGPLYLISWIIILIRPTVPALYIARVLQGLSMGVVFTVVPLYLSEISSPGIRGSISSLFHNAWYLGHVIEYCMGPFLSYHTFTCATAALPVLFMAAFYTQPESPYYLLMQRDEPAAARSLARLRGCDQDAVQEELRAMVQSAQEEIRNKASWRDIVRTRADRRALYIVVGLGMVRVLNGLIAVMTYSTQIFSVTNSTIPAKDITISYGIVMFISSFFVALIADLSGRRQLLLCSCLGSCIHLFLAGGYFYLDTRTSLDVTPYSWFPVVAIIVFSLFVSLGLGPVSVMYQAEMFLSNTRGVASSISAINLTVNAFVILKLYQVIADNIGVFFIFWLFATACLLGSFWIYFTVPETMGKTFAQIRQELISSIKNTGENRSTKIQLIPKIEISDVPI